MFGKKIKVITTISGHYAIALNAKIRAVTSTDNQASSTVLFSSSSIKRIDNANTDEKRRMCVKIHKQFGQATGSKLRKLLSDAQIKDKEMI